MILRSSERGIGCVASVMRRSLPEHPTEPRPRGRPEPIASGPRRTTATSKKAGPLDSGSARTSEGTRRRTTRALPRGRPRCGGRTAPQDAELRSGTRPNAGSPARARSRRDREQRGTEDSIRRRLSPAAGDARTRPSSTDRPESSKSIGCQVLSRPAASHREGQEVPKVGDTGLEPVTSSVSWMRASQLRQSPVWLPPALARGRRRV